MKGLINYLDENIYIAYNKTLLSTLLKSELVKKHAGELTIVYTPLHGAGDLPVRCIFASAGFHKVHVVKEQQSPDPHFSTVVSPNPEEHAAFKLAIDYGKKYDADILIATDPDADR